MPHRPITTPQTLVAACFVGLSLSCQPPAPVNAPDTCPPTNFLSTHAEKRDAELCRQRAAVKLDPITGEPLCVRSSDGVGFQPPAGWSTCTEPGAAEKKQLEERQRCEAIAADYAAWAEKTRAAQAAAMPTAEEVAAADERQRQIAAEQTCVRPMERTPGVIEYEKVPCPYAETDNAAVAFVQAEGRPTVPPECAAFLEEAIPADPASGVPSK
jgi:hypothetical protein